MKRPGTSCCPLLMMCLFVPVFAWSLAGCKDKAPPAPPAPTIEVTVVRTEPRDTPVESEFVGAFDEFGRVACSFEEGEVALGPEGDVVHERLWALSSELWAGRSRSRGF